MKIEMRFIDAIDKMQVWERRRNCGIAAKERIEKTKRGMAAKRHKRRKRRPSVEAPSAAGGEPLWIAAKDPTIFVSARCLTPNLIQQAAPANVSTRIKSAGTSSGTNLPTERWAKRRVR